jgi:hypothetical protein
MINPFFAIRIHLYKYSDFYTIISTTILSVIIYNYFDNEPEFPIAIFAAGISISFGFRQYRIENDKIFKELFLMFNDKYDRKFNECLNIIDKNTNNDPNYQLSEKEQKLVIDYLNFCSEEYLWFRKNRIDRLAWFSWEKGMKYYLSIKSIKEHIVKEKPQKDSYYGFFEKFKI